MSVAKVQLLLSVRTEALSVLESRMASEGQRIRGRLPSGSRHRRVMHLPDDPVRKVAHGAVAGGAPLEAMFEVSHRDGGRIDELVTAVEEVPGRLQEWADPKTSAVVVGTEHVIVAGDEPFVLLYPLRRLPRLTHEEFTDYWLNTHADVARKVPDVQGYRQFHADPQTTAKAAQRLGVGLGDFDGVAEAYHSNLQTFNRIMSRPEVAEAAVADEKNFIDHDRSVMVGLCRVAWDARS